MKSITKEAEKEMIKDSQHYIEPGQNLKKNKTTVTSVKGGQFRI